MEKHFTSFLWIVLLLATACEKEDINYAQSIQGDWYQEAGEIDDTNFIARNQLHFRTDGTFEEAYLIVERDNPRQIVGYSTLIVGEYEVRDNVLILFNAEQYGLDNENAYLDRDDLVLENTDMSYPDIELSLDDSAEKLTLDYCPGGPCPGYGSYVEFQVFYRMK